MTLAPGLTSALLSWYEGNKRDLPWRGSSGAVRGKPAEPYAILVSEFMLQQTTVPAVLPYFRKWMVKYPVIEDLAAADLDEVLRDWEGLGYYSRARNLHTAARQIVRQYGGAIPRDPDILKMLPGIGDYTAAAVSSIAFCTRVPALDANNARVWSRLLTSSNRKWIARVFARVLSPDRPGDFNQALMDLGTAICTPAEARCLECPLAQWCRAFLKKCVDKYPAKTPRPETVRVEAALGIIIKGDKILVQRRPDSGLLAGLWEFPGGKIKDDVHMYVGRSVNAKQKNANPASTLHAHTHTPELPEETVVREVFEETGLRIQVSEKLGIFNHSYTRFRVRLHVFLCKRMAGKLRHLDARWVTPKELERLPMPSANRRIVSALEKYMDAQTR